MSASRKLLKIISLITILSGISYLVLGLLMAGLGLFGGADPIIATDHASLDAQGAGTLLASIAGISAAAYLLLGFLGLRGANVPSKIGPVYALSIVGIAMAVVNVLYWAWQGFSNIDAGSIINLVITAAESVLIFMLARNIKKEREIWH